MVHPSAIRAFIVFCSIRLFLFMLRPARWLGRLTSPRRHPRRQARPFTAELAPTGVSSSQSLLSLLGPTTYCRDGILTRSCIKERRLHQKQTKGRTEIGCIVEEDLLRG